MVITHGRHHFVCFVAPSHQWSSIWSIYWWWSGGPSICFPEKGPCLLFLSPQSNNKVQIIEHLPHISFLFMPYQRLKKKRWRHLLNVSVCVSVTRIDTDYASLLFLQIFHSIAFPRNTPISHTFIYTFSVTQISRDTEMRIYISELHAKL